MNHQTITARERAHAWLELTRISNLPTAWSNTLVGALLTCGVFVTDDGPAEVAPGWWMVLPVLGASLLYMSGMAMNDTIDAGHDADHRRSRPIPSGRITRRSAARFAYATMLAGIALCSLASVACGVLAVCVGGAAIAYNRNHKRTAWAIIPMGLCRGLLPLLGATAAPGNAWLLGSDARLAGLALFGYTALLTLAACKEDIAGARPPLLVSAIVPLPVFVAIALVPLVDGATAAWFTAIVPAIALLVWHSRSLWLTRITPPKMVHAVMGWLAGLCLVDLLFVRTLGHVHDAWTLGILGCFMLTALAHRRIPGS